MLPSQRSSLPMIACVALAFLLTAVSSKSLCGIGMRVRGDQLLMKDALQSRSPGIGQNQEIYFNYAIPQPITHIKIESIENIQAEVNFMYQEDLITGHVTAMNNSPSSMGTPFAIFIEIYGFNETLLNANPRYILNQNQHFKRHIEPELNEMPADADAESDEEDDDDDTETVTQPITHMELTAEMHSPLDASDYDYEEDDDEELENPLQEGIEDVDEDAYELTDAIIRVGERQEDDYLLYETDLISSSKLAGESMPSVVFYYIDSNFITFVKFSIIDHYADTYSGGNSKTPTVEYSHLSPKTLKAVIIDSEKPSMFAKMSVYGYKPADRPVDYVTFLANIAGPDTLGEMPLGSTESTWSYLRSRFNMEFMTSAPAAGEHLLPAHKDSNGALQSANEHETNGASATKSSTQFVYFSSIFATSLMVLMLANQH